MNDDKIMDDLVKMNRVCKCSNRVYFASKKYRQQGWRICDWCGEKVYFNDKERFKDKLRREMRKYD